MISKTKKKNDAEKRGKVKVADLKLKKETVKDLADAEAKKVQGGRRAGSPPDSACAKGCVSWSHNYCPE